MTARLEVGRVVVETRINHGTGRLGYHLPRGGSVVELLEKALLSAGFGDGIIVEVVAEAEAGLVTLRAARPEHGKAGRP